MKGFCLHLPSVLCLCSLPSFPQSLIGCVGFCVILNRGCADADKCLEKNTYCNTHTPSGVPD